MEITIATCPYCKEVVSMETFDLKEVHIECSNCNVLTQVKNGQIKKSTMKFKENPNRLKELYQQIEDLKNGK
jgi:Zn ribbon nucleic-acid-binding protein